MNPSVTIGTPHNRDLAPEYVLSLIALLRGNPLNLRVHMYQSCLVHVGRNIIAQSVLRSGSEYLLFIDSDISFPPWAVERLLSHKKDIVGGMYFKKAFPHAPLVYSCKGENYECIHNPPSTLFECDGLGTGFLLIHRKVLEKLSKDKWVKKHGFPFNFMQKKDGNDIGEDLAFCLRARRAGFKVFCDPSIPLQHQGEMEFDSKSFYNGLKEKSKIEAYPYDNQIEGWMSKEELNWLYKVAGTMNSIVEIGSWKGRSTHALLSACKGTVTAIDHFKGSPGEQAHKNIDPYPDFLRNVGQFDNLKVLKMDSTKAAKKVGKVDMVFIDGAHTYEAVKKDIQTWLPKTRKIICGHDFIWPGVQQAVTETLGFVHTCGTIWYKQL